MMHAVITGDIIHSTALGAVERKIMLDVLKQVFTRVEGKTKKNIFRVYRGDSFQGIIQKPDQALLCALKIKTALLRTSLPEEKKQKLDARIAIGIGKTELANKKMELSDGEAFRNSGQLLNPKTKEDYKRLREYKLLFKSPWEEVNREMEVLFSALDGLLSKWTIEQAEVIYELLNNKNQTQVARQLKKSQGAISERVQNANWLAISNILKRFEEVIQFNLKH